jgi:hypothetical protein
MGNLHFQTSFVVLLHIPSLVKNLYRDPVVNFLEEDNPRGNHVFLIPACSSDHSLLAPGSNILLKLSCQPRSAQLGTEIILLSQILGNKFSVGKMSTIHHSKVESALVNPSPPPQEFFSSSTQKGRDLNFPPVYLHGSFKPDRSHRGEVL